MEISGKLQSFWIDWTVTLKKQFGEVLGDFEEYPLNFGINFDKISRNF